jgi:uncharacterized phage protein gp47/JayE
MALTATGFERKTIEEVKTAIEGRLLAAFPALNLESSFIRNLVDAAADEYDLLWQAAEAVYHSQYPSSADGASLDEVAAITGTLRRPATRSTVVATVTIDPGTYPAQSLIASVLGNPTARYRNREAVTNPGGTPAPFDVLFEAEEPGPDYSAPAGTLTVIAEPFSGWISVTNASGDTAGLPIETDAELRVRRLLELGARGTGTLAGIRGTVADVDGVIEVKVFENVFDVPVSGLPGHSFEVVLWDGFPSQADDDELAEAIFGVKGAGIQAFGDTVVQVEADDGLLHDVGFTRATGTNIWIEVDLAVDPDTYAGDAAVEAAIRAEADERQGIGDDVIASRYVCAALDVAGVLDVLELRLGTAASPVGTANIPIGDHAIALIREERITVDVP